MKLLVVLAAVTALCAGSAVPVIPGDNRNYVEGESRYIWMPDGKGVPHLVDLQATVDERSITAGNGADNQYWLYTQQNPSNYQLLVHGDENSVSNSNYNGNKPLNVIVHGWNSNGNSDMNPLITAAFLAVQDCNVIVVDWHELANNILYNVSAAGVPSVGQFLGNFLIWLLSTAGGNWDNVHLVGFSLGAHVVGNAGRTIGTNTVSRVTGLDPAGPLFGGNSQALNANDAQYVEAIHTDGGTLGIFDPIAHANFYPNGGRYPQPGCWTNICSHGRAHELFASTIYFNHLVGRECPNIGEAQLGTCNGTSFNMGNSIINKRGSGLYALLTGDSWPY